MSSCCSLSALPLGLGGDTPPKQSVSASSAPFTQNKRDSVSNDIVDMLSLSLYGLLRLTNISNNTISIPFLIVLGIRC